MFLTPVLAACCAVSEHCHEATQLAVDVAAGRDGKLATPCSCAVEQGLVHLPGSALAMMPVTPSSSLCQRPGPCTGWKGVPRRQSHGGQCRPRRCLCRCCRLPPNQVRLLLLHAGDAKPPLWLAVVLELVRTGGRQPQEARQPVQGVHWTLHKVLILDHSNSGVAPPTTSC